MSRWWHRACVPASDRTGRYGTRLGRGVEPGRQRTRIRQRQVGALRVGVGPRGAVTAKCRDRVEEAFHIGALAAETDAGPYRTAGPGSGADGVEPVEQRVGAERPSRTPMPCSADRYAATRPASYAVDGERDDADRGRRSSGHRPQHLYAIDRRQAGDAAAAAGRPRARASAPRGKRGERPAGRRPARRRRARSACRPRAGPAPRAHVVRVHRHASAPRRRRRGTAAPRRASRGGRPARRRRTARRACGRRTRGSRPPVAARSMRRCGASCAASTATARRAGARAWRVSRAAAARR